MPRVSDAGPNVSSTPARVGDTGNKARIEGVAGGQYDMALVTDSPAVIHRIARMELHIETLTLMDLIRDFIGLTI